MQIIPSVISQGDTARVVLKKRGVNGLEDFAADKLFNVEIVQGLEYGLILDSLSNDTLNIFSNIPQGFKIIAKDSIETDSTNIRIKVTTEESGFPEERMIRNNTKQNKKEIVDDNETQKSDDEIITPDWIIPGPILLEGFGDVVVKKDGDWCDSLIICNSSEYLPNILLNQVPNGYYGRDICNDEVRPLEGINAYWTDTLYTIDLSLCKNDQRQKLWFSITDNHTLKINYSYAFCEENLIYSGENCQFIDDWTGISDTLDCNQFEAVLHATYLYGGHANKPCYFFKNIIYAHEMEHIMDYQSAIDAVKISFYDDLDSVNVICSDFENMNSAKIYIQSLLDDRFNKFKRSGREEFIKIQMIGALRSKTKMSINSYEQDVQNRKSVRTLINSQIDEVNNTYNCSIIHLYE
ncbi:MAG: hypothetical protein WAU11_15265 [Ignavibacteriaceae bacterium]